MGLKKKKSQVIELVFTHPGINPLTRASALRCVWGWGMSIINCIKYIIWCQSTVAKSVHFEAKVDANDLTCHLEMAGKVDELLIQLVALFLL